MTLRSVVKTAIEGDGTLAALLTGGVHAVTEISREEASGAFDANGEIQPCALVKLPSEFSDGPLSMTGRQALDIYIYERQGYATIDQCLDPLRALLHRQKIGAAADKIFEVRHTDDVKDQRDIATGWSLHLSRFEIWRFRGTG